MRGAAGARLSDVRSEGAPEGERQSNLRHL
jgi:hypothetical protein